MTYPQQPGFPQVPQQAAAPAPQYAQPQPQYAPQPGFGGYPQQGFPQPPQQPSTPLASGSLDAFFSQPSSGGGAALKFPQQGAAHVGVIARPVTNGDIQQQTQVGTNQPAFYRDGRPKFVMRVPLRVPVTPEHQDGQAQWFVAGQARDELVRAMAEVGAPEGPPEHNAVIYVQLSGTRSAGPGMNAAKVYSVRYWRPGDAEGAAFAAQCGIAVDSTPPAAQPAPVQSAPAPVQQAPAPVQQAPAPVAVPQPPAPTAAPVAAPVAAAAPAPPVPTGNGALSADQQALLAQLTGQPAG